MLRFDLISIFNTIVVDKLKKRLDGAELIKFIKNHERRNVFLDNMCKQIEGYEKAFPRNANNLGVAKIISACADMIIHAAIKQRDESNMSDGDKTRLRSIDSATEEMKEIFKEVNETHYKLTK